MKINNKQASLLAKEIFNQLLKSNVQEVSPLIMAKLEKFKTEKERLVAIQKKAEAAIDEHNKTLVNIVGRKAQIKSYWNIEQMVQELEKVNMPNLSEIEDKIILKSMFSSEEDMNAFVAQIVKEYTKKKTVKQE